MFFLGVANSMVRNRIIRGRIGTLFCAMQITINGVIIEVDRSKLGMDGNGVVDVLNLKCDPTIIGMLRMQAGFYPAYHMNKEKWVSILLCGPVADDEIKELIEFSYQLTSSRRKGAKLGAQN
jgi:predicted DNA-binding protein (MmcQ/YjbR family)